MFAPLMAYPTVDGPAKSESPVNRWFIPVFIGFQPSKVVQDFATIHSSISTSWSLSLFRKLSAFSVSNQSLFAASGSFGPMRGQTFRGLAVTNGWILDHLEVSYGSQILQAVMYWDPCWGWENMSLPAPWCWNMHTYILCQTWHSFVGVHIPAAWFASGTCLMFFARVVAENARKWVGPYAHVA